MAKPKRRAEPRIVVAKSLVHLAALTPLAILLWQMWSVAKTGSNALGADPVAEIEHRLGLWAIRFLMISLATVAITRDPYITIVLISIGGFGHQIISCMLSALVVESFDKGQMATVNGMRGSAAWIASFLFSLLIGVTADKIGFNPLFIAMGFFDLIGAVFLVAFIAERRAKRA